jgi:hypothetical protein
MMSPNGAFDVSFKRAEFGAAVAPEPLSTLQRRSGIFPESDWELPRMTKK